MGLGTQEDESEHRFSNEDYGEGDLGVVTLRDAYVRRYLFNHASTTAYNI